MRFCLLLLSLCLSLCVKAQFTLDTAYLSRIYRGIPLSEEEKETPRLRAIRDTELKQRETDSLEYAMAAEGHARTIVLWQGSLFSLTAEEYERFRQAYVIRKRLLPYLPSSGKRHPTQLRYARTDRRGEIERQLAQKAYYDSIVRYYAELDLQFRQDSSVLDLLKPMPVPECPEPDTIPENTSFDFVFGADPLLTTGVRTLNIENGDQLEYSCFECMIRYRRKNGKVRWEKDLSRRNCMLQSFVYYSNKKESGKPLALVQLACRRVYELRLRNGRLKEMRDKTPSPSKRKKTKTAT